MKEKSNHLKSILNAIAIALVVPLSHSYFSNIILSGPTTSGRWW